MANANKIKREKRMRRHRRVRAVIRGTASRPRLSIFRSNKHIFLQLIDDEKGKTLVSISDAAISKKGKAKMAKKDLAYVAGKELVLAAKKKKIRGAVFDRGGYKYHGRVKAAAEGAKEEGLIF